ncbi:MAG: response regulator [Magnetococcales bacterium]|nr:response regulator [Magnetococcales bacterium]
MKPTAPILLVEDSAIQRVMLQRMLEQAGYATVTALDGAEGLLAARRHRPCLIITDISMPNMDGYEMCRAVKQDPAIKHIAVLILTGLDDPREVIRGLNAGADNFLTKSSDEARILERVAALLANSTPETDDGGPIEVVFAGEPQTIHATRQQTVNLLLSTYESAVRQNRQLIETQQELKLLNQHLEEKVRQRTRELEVANRAKSVFIANMSHELRTPMNAIIGMTELVLGTQLDDTHREYLGIVRDSSETLLFFINTLLDFTQMEIGSLRVVPRPFGLRAELERMTHSFTAKARDQGLAFSWRVDDAVPNALFGDFPRTRQILVQLLANAFKFTPKGAVTLEASLTAQGEEHLTLRFSVRDTGIGIDPKEADLVFESFVQGDGSSTRKYGGAGLGLSVVRGLCRLLEGRVWFTSVPNEGSVFHCELPFQRSPEEDATRAPSATAGLTTNATVAASRPEPGALIPEMAPTLLVELGRMLEANDLTAEQASARFASFLSHSPDHALAVEMEAAVRDLDFDRARARWRELARRWGIAGPAGQG